MSNNFSKIRKFTINCPVFSLDKKQNIDKNTKFYKSYDISLFKGLNTPEDVLDYQTVQSQLEKILSDKQKQNTPKQQEDGTKQQENELSTLTNVNDQIRQYANNTSVAQLSVEDFYATQVKNQKGFLGSIKAIKTYNSISTKDTETRKAYAKSIRTVNKSLGNQLEKLNGANAGAKTYFATLRSMGSAAFNSFMSFGLNMLVDAAFSAYIALGSKLLDYLITTQEEIEEKAQQIKEEFNNQSETIKGNLEEVEDFSDEFNKLAKGVDNYGKNISLTSEEYDRYLEISNRLAELNPELIKGYDAQGNAILDTKDAIDQTVKSLKDLQNENNRTYTTTENMQTTMKAYKDEYENFINPSYYDNLLEAKLQANELFPDYLIKAVETMNRANEEVYNLGSSADEKYVDEIESLTDRWNTVIKETGIYEDDGITMKVDATYDELNPDKIRELIDIGHQLSNAYANIGLNSKYSELLTQLMNDIYSDSGGVSTGIFASFLSEDYVYRITSETEAAKAAVQKEKELLDEEIRKPLKDYGSTIMYSYDDISDSQYSFIQSWLEDFNVDKIIEDNFSEDSINNAKGEIRNFITGIMDAVETDEKLALAIDTVYELNMDSDSMSVGEKEKKVSEIVNSIFGSDWNKLPDGSLRYESKDKIRLLLGFDIKLDDGSQISASKDLVNRVKERIIQEFDVSTIPGKILIQNKLMDVSEQQLNEIFEALSSADFDSSKYNGYSDFINSILSDVLSADFNYSDYSEQIDSVTQKISKLRDVYDNIKENGGLTEEEKMSLVAEFPDLLPYINDVETLKEKIYEMADSEPQGLIDTLTKVKSQLTDENQIKAVENLIRSLKLLADLNHTVDEPTSPLEKAKAAIEDNISATERQIERLEDEKDIQNDILDALNKQKEAYEEIIQNYETAASTVTSAIDDEISALEDQKSAIEEKYNSEIEALQSENEERDRNIELREKELALEKAKNTKVRVYSASRGWTIQTDSEAVAQAQREYDETVNNIRIEELEEQRDKEAAIYDERIEEYEEYKKLWQEAVDSYQRSQDEITTAALLGSNWREQIHNKDIGVLNSFAANYGFYQNQLHSVIEPQIEDVQNTINAYDAQIDSLNNLKTKQEEYLTFYENYTENYEALTNRQAESLERLKKAKEEVNAAGIISGALDVGISSVLLGIGNYAGSFANGGIVNKTGVARVHGTKNNPEIMLNASQAVKLWKWLESSDTMIDGVLQADKVMDKLTRFFNSAPQTLGDIRLHRSTGYDGIPSFAGEKIESTKIVNQKFGNTQNSYTWAISGNNLAVDSYDKFKGYMDRYVREAQMNLDVGKKR